MTRYVVLLRGVNVGGHHPVKMADFAALLTSLGCSQVATYLQSGNAVVTASADRSALQEGVAAALGVGVLLRTSEQWAAVIAGNPYGTAAAADPTTVHAALLSATPTAAAYARLDPTAYAPDACALGDAVLYLHYPNGAGRSKLTGTVLERLGVVATARNWRTVEALRDLLDR